VGLASAAGVAGAAEAGEKPKKEYYELRLYRVDAGPIRERLDAFLRDAAIPAWNRIGIANVGVFQLMEGNSADLYVLLTHKTIESFATAAHRLLADAEYRKAGAAVLEAPKAEPGFKRIESSLLLAFDEIPQLEVPPKKETRVFQLRTYESHCDAKAQKKIEMFNGGGEIALFRRTSMRPVFFGESLIGTKLPNLTYMLVFDDMDAQKAAWARFLADPEWTKLKNDPQYADTVSNITNILLKPTPYSQI
jgi:hypothetical protein